MGEEQFSNDNAYKITLACEYYSVNVIYNVVDLSLFIVGNENSESNSDQEWEGGGDNIINPNI